MRSGRRCTHREEELQAANEELQSTNEELQSANEELTTSKEEAQSMNEELQTINAELQTKLDDLALAQSDMQNLLNSTDIATLFLDKDLNVRRFTDKITRIIHLREGDIGRPLSDLASTLNYPAAARRRQGDPAHPGVLGEADFDDRWALVHGPHHAVPHGGERDPGRGDHPHRHHGGEGTRVAPAQGLEACAGAMADGINAELR